MLKYVVTAVVIFWTLSSPGIFGLLASAACLFWCFRGAISGNQASQNNPRQVNQQQNQGFGNSSAGTQSAGSSQWDDVMAGNALPITVRGSGGSQTMFLSNDPEVGKNQLAALLGQEPEPAPQRVSPQPASPAPAVRPQAAAPAAGFHQQASSAPATFGRRNQ